MASELQASAPTRFLPCPLCEGHFFSVALDNLQDYLTHERFAIGRCTTCGLLVTQRLPSGRNIGEYYGPRYRGNRHSFTARMCTRRRRRMLEKQLPRGFRGRLLDIGCGNGDFVREMARRGWSVAATEMDDAIVQQLRGEGIEAHCAVDLTRTSLQGPFDAITCWHVLEHTDAVRPTLAAIFPLLAPRGIFQVTVPDAGSWHARLCGAGWLHYDVPRHRIHFSLEHLQRILESEGFEIVAQRHTALEYDWFGLAQGILNRFSRQPNVLFERITHGAFPEGTSLRDRAMSLTVGPLMCTATFFPVALLALVGSGATLTLTVRKASCGS